MKIIVTVSRMLVVLSLASKRHIETPCGPEKPDKQSPAGSVCVPVCVCVRAPMTPPSTGIAGFGGRSGSVRFTTAVDKSEKLGSFSDTICASYTERQNVTLAGVA